MRPEHELVPVHETELKDVEWLMNRLLDEDRRDELWCVDAEAFIENRVPRLIEEIRKLKKKLGLSY